MQEITAYLNKDGSGRCYINGVYYGNFSSDKSRDIMSAIAKYNHDRRMDSLVDSYAEINRRKGTKREQLVASLANGEKYGRDYTLEYMGV